MENKSIKHRLLQGRRQKSPPFLLEESTEGPTLKLKKLQESTSVGNLRPQGLMRPGRGVGEQPTSPQGPRRRPVEVEQEKLSKQARSMIEEGKQRIRSNLRPHDIFQLYTSFPEMLQDFFYLNRKDHPYDYQIVTYAQRNPQEYMTISSQGVTLYHDKEAEFLTQQQWLADEKRYFALQKISFFRQYKLSKNFRIWKNRMRRHYMREMSGILNEHLFLTMHHPRRCLLQLKYYTNTLKDSLSFFPFEALDRLAPSDFAVLLQEHKQKTLLRGVKDITKAITLSLEQAVTEEINKFRGENNIKIEGVSEGQAGNKEGYVYSQEAILKKQYKRVYKLIKLADGMLQEAKIQMILHCLQQLLERIRDLSLEEKEPWITCAASLDEQGHLHWEPGREALCALFLDTVKQHIAKLNEHNDKIVNNAVFQKYRVADSPEGRTDQVRTSLKAMVEESPCYFSLLEQIEKVLGEEFGCTVKEEAQLQKYVEVFLRHKQLQDMGTIFRESSGVDLCNYVDQWKRDEKTMAELPQDKKGSLLLYNYSAMRKHIVNLPKQTLANFFLLLPEETSLRSRDLTNEARGLLQSISSYPTDIVSFAKFNKAVRIAGERLDDIRSAGSEICLLIDLMGRNKLGNVQTFNGKKVEALNAINALKSKVEESQAKENESLSRFKRENELEIAKIKVSSKELEGRFNGIEFNQVKATAKEMKQILAKIREILPAVRGLESQTQKITEIEHELGLGRTDFSDVHVLYENTLLVNDTWSCRDDWKNLLVGLYHKHYTEVDCLQLRAKWEQFQAKISALARTLPDNDILKNLSQQLSEVEVLIDTVAALTSPNLDQKSWRQISEYLAYELGIENEVDFPFREPHNSNYTVKWLLQLNVPVYKQRIEFIVRKSEKEKELVVELNDFRNYLAGMVFETVQKKNEFYLFGENKELQRVLQRNLAHLYAMLGSQYSPVVQHEAETLIKHYEYVEEITKFVLDFASLWSKYEPFFDPSSPALKFLTKENKEFSSWEAQWKKIIKSMTADSLSFYRRVCDQTLGASPSRSTIKQISKINSTIDTIRKGLEEYLQRKRGAFPRYYFVPDEELLKMLGRVDLREPISNSFVPIIYKHLQRINYREDTKDTLLGVVSKEGEQFELKPVNFKLQSQMEDIFKLAEEQIKKRLNYLIKNVFLRYTEEEITRKAMIMENNVQVVLAVDYVAWVRLAEETYLCPEPIGDLYDWIAIQQEQLRQQKTLFEGKLSPVSLHKMTQLMSQSLYMLQKTRQLLRGGVDTTDCYDWERIPKICLSSNNSDLFYKQLGQKLNYCYEFLGSSAPLALIEPSTEKAWLNISQAVANRDAVCLRSKDQRADTLRQLASMLGQEVEQIAVGQNLNFKVLERFVNGGLGTGHWVFFNWPQTQEMLTFLANQLNNAKKALFDTAFEKTKSSFSVANNLAFFLVGSEQQKCDLKELLAPFGHRDITLYPPNWLQVCCILSESHSWPLQAAPKVMGVLEAMRDCFQKRYSIPFTHLFASAIFRKVMSLHKQYEWLLGMKCKQFYEYVTCEVLDEDLLPSLRKDDVKVYEILKTAIIPDYQKYRTRHPVPHHSKLRMELVAFLQNNKISCKNQEYVDKLEALVWASQSDLMGVILCGSPLAGKSTLIQLAAKFIEAKGTKVKTHRIYHNAYSLEQLFENDRGLGIIPEALSRVDSACWIVMDGSIPRVYLQLFGRVSDVYLVPEIGVISSPKNLKFVIETYDIASLSPSIVGNNSVIMLGEEIVSSEQIVRKELAELERRGFTVNLSTETLQYLITVLSSALSRFQNKGSFKSKLITFAYPLNNSEITFRCCRLLRAIFTMNWESIRDKQKNSKRVIDRLVSWLLYWGLLGLVLVDDESKLQKYVAEVTKDDNFGTEELQNSIIYPNCGLEVQLMSGLRTQSSLGIPEKGIITNVLRTDLTGESEGTKNNKFFQEIVISQAHLIRVNYYESNRYNYMAQIASQVGTPMMLIGPQNSGKKTIVELYAKNMRNKSQFCSIRYRNRETLPSQIEKPFRRLNGLEGIVMKSVTVSKKLIVSIQDLFLDSKNNSTSQMLRMLFNEGGYYNIQSQWAHFTNCSFNLIVSKICNETDCLRLLPQLGVFQTSQNTYEKLYAIYSPYLKNWAAFNGLNGEVQRIFNSQNGDSLLDGILSIYRLLDGLYQADPDKQSLEILLAKPRIGDIARTLMYICRTPEANHYNMAYYYELWAHEVIRVFGDRLREEGVQKAFFKELKKQALVKFKENFSFSSDSMFIFTSLGIENENCYIRVEDPAFLHNYISNLLEADEINLPLKYLFNELLSYLLRIYRVMAVEGAHLMLLGPNRQTLTYLIQLACQVGQNTFFNISEAITAEKHIEQTLYFKENVCLSGDVDNLSEEIIYQMSCLLNSNVYEFEMSLGTKERIKNSLTKKEKAESGKKQTKSFGKNKNEQKVEQKEEDSDQIMAEQFMTFTHFVLQASPVSLLLKGFLKRQSDIVGKLHFCWVDVPQASLVKVARQILSFDQEVEEMKLKWHSDEKIIEKIQKICAMQAKEDSYFNDFLTICQVVKSQSIRIGTSYRAKEEEIRQGRQKLQKVKSAVTEKEENMKLIHEELEGANAAIELKNKDLEELVGKINELQMSISSEEPSSQNLVELKVAREEIEIDLKLLKDKKDKLEPQKKKILKGIKIGNDYLDLFGNSFDFFDGGLRDIIFNIENLEDDLIIIWCAISFLLKVPSERWVDKINCWMSLINSSRKEIGQLKEVVELMNTFLPEPYLREDVFCPEAALKIKSLFWMLHFYEETVIYGSVLKVYDPKNLLIPLFERIGTETNQFALLNIFDFYTNENRGEIEMLTKSRNGYLVLENSREVEELESYFSDRKMTSYLNKVIVLSKQQEAHLALDCHQNQLQYIVEDFMLRSVNPGLFNERKMLYDQVAREKEKISDATDILYRACANINHESQTYIEEVSKCKTALNTVEELIKRLNSQLQTKLYLQMPQFQMCPYIVRAFQTVWLLPHVQLKLFTVVYQEALVILFGGKYQEMPIEEKGEELSRIVEFNLGKKVQRSLEDFLLYSRRWTDCPTVLWLKPCKTLLQRLQLKVKPINLLGSYTVSETSCPKVLFNIYPSIHDNIIRQSIAKLKLDSKLDPLIVMITEKTLKLMKFDDCVIRQISEINIPQQEKIELGAEGKEIEKIRKYLSIQKQSWDEKDVVIQCLEKNQSRIKSEDLKRLIGDITSLTAQEIETVLQTDSSILGPLIDRISQHSSDRQMKKINKASEIVSTNMKEELPFLFNVSEFLPSKDPLTIDLISECLKFNRRLKKAKENLIEYRFEWHNEDNLGISSQDLLMFHQEYYELKRSLIKLQVLSGNHSSTGNLSTSVKMIVSSSNPNLLWLPPPLFSLRSLCLLRCRFTKKMKSKLSNISIVWKVSGMNSSQEQVSPPGDLAITIGAEIADPLAVVREEILFETKQNLIDLIATPVDTAHESKTTSVLSTNVPIISGDEVLGSIQFGRSDNQLQKVMGFRYLSFVVNK